jgi:chitinase
MPRGFDDACVNQYTVVNMKRIIRIAVAILLGLAGGTLTLRNEVASALPVPPDLTAPTAPGDLRVVFDNGVTLVWQPSTDDSGVVQYEVYESGRLLATVAETGYRYSTGPAIPPRVYVFGVRAVDAAGNISPSDFAVLGPAFQQQQPAPPSALRVTALGPPALRLAWDAPPAQSVPPFAPIAGYEVYVNGQLAGRVGGTSFAMPTPRRGRYTFSVRAFNAVDLFSSPVEIRVTVR